MISALKWVPKGAAKRVPHKFIPSEEEMKMIQQLAELEETPHAENVLEMNKENQLEPSSKLVSKNKDEDKDNDDDLPPEFKMDEYDQEDNVACLSGYTENCMDDVDNDDMDAMEVAMSGVDLTSNYLQDDIDDDDEEEEDEEDEEDQEIRPDDAVLLVANTEDDYSILEVHIYEEETGNFYVHHDITLPAFPLALAWMNCPPLLNDEEKDPLGSYVAVGTFKPGIEIWNLDVMDVIEPTAVLGGEIDLTMRNVALPTGKKKKLGAKMKPGSHTDAVMTLDWNEAYRNMLASGSADKTVKIWDITTCVSIHTFNHHSDKVQSVAWNPAESTILASGSFDQKIAVLDCRHPDTIARFSLTSNVECMCWDPNSPSDIYAATENGQIYCFDVRMVGKPPKLEFNAHDSAVTSMSFSHQVKGMFATASVDKTVKIWDLDEPSTSPQCVATKAMGVGQLFSISYYKSSPFLLASGGSKGSVALWDTLENKGVEKKFSNRVENNVSLTNPSTSSSSAATTASLDSTASRD